MEPSIPQETFDSAYESNSAPWVIGEPQPAIVGLERDGLISGSVLDVGCGSGEHTIYLAERGYRVKGIDFAKRAIETARENAAARGVETDFEVADALNLGAEPTFDTIVDSALFHAFGDEDRAAYVRSLHAVCREDAIVHVLALSDAGPGFGPQVSETTIREAFVDGWVLEDLQSTEYRGFVGPEHAEELGMVAGETVDVPAWLARIRRS